MDEKSKLVYTSDRKDPNFLNNVQIGLETKPKEIINEYSKDIHLIKQSLPNTKSGGKLKMKKQSEKSIEVIKRVKNEFTSLVTFLSSGKKDVTSLKNHLKLSGVKFSNFMQKAKEASQKIIQNKDGLWFIVPGYISGNEALINKMVENRNAVFNNWLARKKEREAQGISLTKRRKIIPQQQITHSPDKIQHVNVEGKTLVQRFTSEGLNAEFRIEPLVNAFVKTNVSINSLTIEVTW